MTQKASDSDAEMPLPANAETAQPQAGAGKGPEGITLPSQPDYDVLDLIGRGAYGEVRLARDRQGTYWAVKVVYRANFDSDRPYEREYNGILQFEPVSKLSDSQLQILHVGRRNEAGYFYYLMEIADDVASGQKIQPETYVPRTLKSELQLRKRISAAESCHIAWTLAVALENLHQHVLVHRDIKPSNVVFVNGRPKLADVGLVTRADLTVSCAGTEGYIPPEGPGTYTADIYSFGKVLYEMCTGRDRMDFPGLPENLEEMPDHLMLLELNALFTKACHVDAKKRYQSASHLREQLERLMQGKSIRRRRTVYRGMAAAVAVLLTVASIAFWPQRRGSEVAGAVPKLNPISLIQSVPRSGRLPVPRPDDVEAAKKRLPPQSTGATQDRTNDNAASLPTTLLEPAASTSDPAMRLAKLELDWQLTLQAGDRAGAAASFKFIEEQFDFAPDQINRLKIRLLEQIKTASDSPPLHSNIVWASLTAGFECLAMDDYPSGARLAEIATESARLSANKNLQALSFFLSNEVHRCSEMFQRIEPYVARLAQVPGDPAANAECGKFLCFEKNAWQRGIPLLLRGDSKPLAELATKELRRPTETAAWIKLGDGWWDLSENSIEPDKARFQRRARHWYSRALARGKNKGNENVRQRVEARLDKVTADSGQLLIRVVADNDTTISIRPVTAIINTRDPVQEVSLNHVNLGGVRAGQRLLCPNFGSSRFLSESVDFSTARLVGATISDQRGRVETFEPAADHLLIRLKHEPAGYAAYDLTIAFGNEDHPAYLTNNPVVIPDR